MAKAVLPLIDTAIRRAKIKDKQYRLSDGDGLYILIKTSGAKLWRFDYVRPTNGKRNTLSLGSYPEIALTTARQKRLEARTQVAEGIDPQEAREVLQGNTFEVVASEWIAAKTPGWKPSHLKKNLGRLNNDLLPWLGSRPIKEITAPVLLKCLRRVEERCTGDAASRCKSIAGQIFRYGIATGRCERDISRDLDGALRKPVSGNFYALTNPEGLAQLLMDVYKYDGRFITCCALRFTMLVFQRPGEIRQAQWCEINLKKARWDIPAEKMKGNKKHFVPLSRQTVAILRDLHPLTGQNKYVFSQQGDRSKPMSDGTVNVALKKMGYEGIMTAHGVRATARTIIDEVLGFPPQVIEKQLAHRVADPLGESYNRAERTDERKKMMQLWADYLDGLKAGVTL